MKTNRFLLPILAGFFVMGFCDIVGTVMTANSFGMCMGLAIDRDPAKANEITALMVMAIVGGAVVTPVIGFAQGAMGASGILAVLLACLAHLFALGIFASGKKGTEAQNEKRTEDVFGGFRRSLDGAGEDVL